MASWESRVPRAMAATGRPRRASAVARSAAGRRCRRTRTSAIAVRRAASRPAAATGSGDASRLAARLERRHAASIEPGAPAAAARRCSAAKARACRARAQASAVSDHRRWRVIRISPVRCSRSRMRRSAWVRICEIRDSVTCRIFGDLAEIQLFVVVQAEDRPLLLRQRADGLLESLDLLDAGRAPGRESAPRGRRWSPRARARCDGPASRRRRRTP